MTVDEVHDRLTVLETHFAGLEAAYEQVRKEKGIPGRRGAPGDIDAAVFNAREALARDLADTMRKFAALEETVRAFNTALDGRIRQKIDSAAASLDSLTASFKNNLEHEIAATVIKVLQEYHVIDEDCVPTAGTYAKKV